MKYIDTLGSRESRVCRYWRIEIGCRERRVINGDRSEEREWR